MLLQHSGKILILPLLRETLPNYGLIVVENNNKTCKSTAGDGYVVTLGDAARNIFGIITRMGVSRLFFRES